MKESVFATRTMPADVSVIIPTFNRRRMVCEAISSVLASRGVSLEIIVIDDGSTDDTWQALERERERACRLGNVLRIVHQARRGPAAARNRGLELANSEFAAFLDSDDLWHPLKLSRQLDFMRQNPRCLISQCQERWLRNERHVNPGRRHLKRGGDIFMESLRTCLISPSALIARTKLLLSAGGFDEAMSACEDYDFWLRILVEHEIGLLNELLVTRRAGHGDQLSAVTPAMDRFRILALAKLLALERLGRLRREAVVNILIEKCEIYAAGLAKRGWNNAARFYLEIAQRAASAWRLELDESLHDAIRTMRSLASLNHSECSAPNLVNNRA